MATPATKLVPHIDAFTELVRRRVTNPELAADIVQESLLKAVRAAPELRDDAALLPWFYRILRNAITDAYRHRATEGRVLDRVDHESLLAFVPQDEAAACACLIDLLDVLKPEYAELIREMDLGGANLGAMENRLGVPRDTLKMRHHRARKRLRALLERTCRTCAAHGCLDCTCRQ